MSYYVTKYALSQGILEFPEAGTKVVDDKYLSRGYYFINPGDWFDCIDAAQADVHEKARRKLKSLAKQRAKVQAVVDNGAKVIKVK